MNQHLIKKQWFLLSAHNLVETKGESKDEESQTSHYHIHTAPYPHILLVCR
jgi:hypothetical protein